MWRYLAAATYLVNDRSDDTIASHLSESHPSLEMKRKLLRYLKCQYLEMAMKCLDGQLVCLQKIHTILAGECLQVVSASEGSSGHASKRVYKALVR